ncbi:type VI secretion system ImpA family N-terminal domain-containing protein, partial [Escherichia coli]
MTSEVKLKTGVDPRSLPDYAALRDEISKLTHPARPDVDWRYVETLCLRLYEHNGVELQTASWYTMNRPGFPGECFICELRLPDHR